MKKALMLMAAIAMMVTPLFADDDAAPTLAGLHAATGSVEFTFGDSDLSDNDGLGFGSDSTGTTASSVTASIATDKVEAGATINLIPTIELEDNDTSDSIDDQDLNFSLTQDVMDWYDGDGTDDYGFTAIDWDAIILAQAADVVVGTTTYQLWTEADGWDGDYIELSEAQWTDALDARNAVIAQIKANIETLTSWGATIAAGPYYEDQHGNIRDDADGIVFGADAASIAAALLLATPLDYLDEMGTFNDAVSDWEAVYGSDDDDTYAVSYPVSDAYFRLLAVAGVVDVEFELNGRAVAVGSKYNVASDDANIGMGVALTSGVIEGLSIDVLYTILAGENDTDEDYETLGIEAADGGEPNHALEFNAGYATDLFSVAAGMAIEDLVEPEVWYTVQAGLTLTDIMGIAVGVELTGIEANIGLAADASATIMGITPSVDFRLRSGLHNSADTDDETTALNYFNTADEDNQYFGVGLAVDLTELMGMGLITLNAGFGIVFGGDMDLSAGLGLNFTDLFAPITLDVAFGQAYDDDLTLGVDLGATFGDFTAGAGIDYDSSEDNLGWNIDLGYTYDIVTIAAGVASDFDDVQSLEIKLSTSF